jgi:small subunit ribosomal protein S6
MSARAMQAGAVQGADEEHSSLNQYEVAVLYHPDLEIDLDKAESRVKEIIEDNKGKITKTDNWGKRKLAYPIAKQDYAVYVFYTAEIPGENVRRVEQTFNITDEVIRFLITKPDLKAMAKAEAQRAEKAKKAAERGEPEDEDSQDESAAG